MMKRNKAILCALAGIGFITSVGTVKANAMTMNTTTKTTQNKLSVCQVENLMWDLPYCINTSPKEQLKTTMDVIKARMAYNSLKPEEKERVDSSALSALRHDEELLKKLIGDEVKALGMVCGILKVEEEVEYNQETRAINTENLKFNKEEIEKIRAEITAIEKGYQKLDYTIKNSAGLSHFMGELNNIECKLLQAKID